MIGASLYMIGWGAGFLCMIGWGAGPCYVILQEEGFLLMSELNKLLLLKFLMNTRTAAIQRESLFMTTLIGLDGAGRSDQITEETSSEIASDKGARGRGKKRGS